MNTHPQPQTNPRNYPHEVLNWSFIENLSYGKVMFLTEKLNSSETEVHGKTLHSNKYLLLLELIK